MPRDLFDGIGDFLEAMSTQTKALWAPTIITILAWLVFLAFYSGKYDEKFTGIDHQFGVVEQQHEVMMRRADGFVPRNEWEEMNQRRDDQIAQIRATLGHMDGKLDTILLHDSSLDPKP